MISQDWNDYNKKIGNSVELDGLPRKTLERIQLEAYTWFIYITLDGWNYLKYFTLTEEDYITSFGSY